MEGDTFNIIFKRRQSQNEQYPNEFYKQHAWGKGRTGRCAFCCLVFKYSLAELGLTRLQCDSSVDNGLREKDLIRRILIGLVLSLIIAACQPAAETAIEPLPTLASLDTPVEFDSNAAQRAALGFLDAWVHGDYDAMYDFIAFSSQEANPKDSFINLYQSSQVSYDPKKPELHRCHSVCTAA